MEITTMKWRGAEVHCLFTGYQYVFYNNYWGILAIADRDDANKNAFTVRYGNEKLTGCSLCGDVCALLAERFIRKDESRYISREISFERKREDLRKWYIESKSLPF